jgi:hypothetical protein
MLLAQQAASMAADEVDAVREIAAALPHTASSAVLFFCSPSYDLDRLGRALKDGFACVVAGCTSAGQVGAGGFQHGGLTAVCLTAPELEVTPFLIAPLAAYRERVAAMTAELNVVRAKNRAAHSFGFMVVDGLSMAEEALTAAVYQALDDVPIIGGSAGDDLRFERTFVYHEGRFLSDAAVFMHFRTTLPFAPFKFQHFAPTTRKLVITEAEPERRTVREINGMPAGEAYAELIGVPPSALDAAAFSRHPLMLKVNGDYYVRSVQRLNADMSLTFYCAIENGLVLTVGEPVDALETMERAFASIGGQVKDPEIVLGCDCVLRRLAFEAAGIAARAGELMARNRVVGFSTYGEQWNAIHVNHTFTGVAIGKGEP